MNNWDEIMVRFEKGDFLAVARLLSLIEYEFQGYEDFLMNLKASPAKIIGITGSPGAGKSTLTDALIGSMVSEGKKVGVLCIDPSSPFHHGALLGDRIRMSEWYNHPGVFIRSLASKGSLGGLHPKIIELSDVMKSAGFDYVIIETVGVGQSEVDIASLADTTVVMLVPEGGDSIQTMKSGLMEVADIFVINKADRPGVDSMFHALKEMLRPVKKSGAAIPVLKTVASNRQGIEDLYQTIKETINKAVGSEKKRLAAEKAWVLIQHNCMKKIDKVEMEQSLFEEMNKPAFNLYRFAASYLQS
jgi:LAO/AO transport system kinase